MPLNLSYLQKKQEILPALDEEISLTDQLSKLVTTPIKSAFDLLDYPGAILRGLFAGKGSSSFNWNDRASGKDVLKNLGLDFGDGIGESIAGFGVELLLDPLLFTKSVTGLAKAGKLAKEYDTVAETIKLAEKVKGGGLATVAVDKSLPNLIKREQELLQKLDGISGGQASLNKKLGIKQLGEDISSQIANKQRGLSFLGQDYAIPVPGPIAKINEVISKSGDLVANTPLGKLIKEKFSTAKATVAGKIFDDFKSSAASAASLESAKFAGKIERSLKTPEAKKALVYMVEDRGITPQLLDDSIKDYTKELATGYIENLKKLNIMRQNVLTNPAYDATKRGEFEKLHASFLKRLKNKFSTKLEKYTSLVQVRKAELAKRAGFINQYGDMPEVKQLADEMGDALDDFLKIEQANFIDVTKLDDPLQSYIPHITTAEGRQFLSENYSAKKSVISSINTQLGFTKGRKGQVGFTLEDMNQTFRKKYNIDFDIFNQDPAAIFASRALSHTNAVSSARNINAAIQLFSTAKSYIKNAKGRILSPLKNLADDEVHFTELLSISGVNGINLGGKDITWARDSKARDIWKTIKTTFGDVDAEKFNFALPTDLVTDIKNMRELSDSPALIKRWMQPINNIYKLLLTAVPPASLPHIGTNIAGFVWMNAVAGINPLKYVPAAEKLLAKFAIDNPDHFLSKAIPDTWKQLNLGIIDDFKLSGASQTHLVAELFDNLSTDPKGSIAQKSYNFLSGKSKIENKTLAGIQDLLVNKSMGMNRFVEEVARLAHFEDRIEKGQDIWQAANSVKKYLFDYSDLTKFEKTYMKNMVLFYTFARKNLPLAMQEMFSNRLAYSTAKLANSTYSDDDTIPEYVKTSLQWKIAPGVFLDPKNPIGEANRFSTQDEGAASTIRKLIGQLNPLLKLPYELSSGIETFRGKPLEELNRLSETYGKMWNYVGLASKVETKNNVEYRMDPSFYHILRSLPVSRISQVFSDLVDPETGISSIAGMRLKRYDPDKLRLQLERAKLTKVIKQSPELRGFTEFFSIEKKPTERSQLLLKRLREINEEIKKAP